MRSATVKSLIDQVDGRLAGGWWLVGGLKPTDKEFKSITVKQRPVSQHQRLDASSTSINFFCSESARISRLCSPARPGDGNVTPSPQAGWNYVTRLLFLNSLLNMTRGAIELQNGKHRAMLHGSVGIMDFIGFTFRGYYERSERSEGPTADGEQADRANW